MACVTRVSPVWVETACLQLTLAPSFCTQAIQVPCGRPPSPPLWSRYTLVLSALSQPFQALPVFAISAGFSGIVLQSKRSPNPGLYVWPPLDSILGILINILLPAICLPSFLSVMPGSIILESLQNHLTCPDLK